MVLFNHKAYPIGENKHGDTLFKPYIKVNLDRSKNPLTTLLYEHIGNYRYKDATGQELEKPVYKLINKKGINQDGVFVLEHDGYDGSGFAFNNIDPRVDHKIVVTTRADDEATLTNRLSNDTIDRIISGNLNDLRELIVSALAKISQFSFSSEEKFYIEHIDSISRLHDMDK